MDWFMHIVTVILAIVISIWTFPISWVLGIVPIFLYLLILWKNTFLLVYTKLVESKLGTGPLELKGETRDLFDGREVFAHSIIQLVIALAFSSIFNLLIAVYISYVAIVKLKYIKI